jgi:hypothetical protein
MWMTLTLPMLISSREVRLLSQNRRIDPRGELAQLT